MRAFVTGGTGFVGSHLVDHLLAEGDEVTCLVRQPQKASRLFPAHPAPEIIRGDLAQGDALRRGVERADVVFHAAALTAARHRAHFFDVNEGGTAHLLQAVREVNPSLQRFVYVSSAAAAGPARRGRALQGDEQENPVTHYGASKLAGELAVRGAGIPWTVIRPPTVYGPRDTEMLKVFQMVRRGVAPVFGDGSQELSVIYVKDLARALRSAARHPDTANKMYYVAHPDIVRSRALVTAIARAVHGREDARPFIVPIPGLVARAGLWLTGTAARLAGRTTLLTADKANEFLAEAWTCSAAAFERDTGWTAGYSLAAGLAETVAWYRDAGWL